MPKGTLKRHTLATHSSHTQMPHTEATETWREGAISPVLRSSPARLFVRPATVGRTLGQPCSPISPSPLPVRTRASDSELELRSPCL